MSDHVNHTVSKAGIAGGMLTVFFDEYIINRYHENDRDDDDRYRGKLWCNDDDEIIN